MKQLTAIGMAVTVCIGGVAYAQSSSMHKDQMDKGMKDGAMTVSGCVAAGKDAGHYMLTNAMMVNGMMDKDKTMTQDKMEPGMSGHMMSYELVGGDLKAHMGHKVEITGAMSKSDMDKMHRTGSMDKMDKDKMDKMDKMDKDMKPMKLNVKSVKMISESCS